MSKPEDIPQDVWDVADQVLCAFSDRHLRQAIALLIMTAKAEERETCACIADDYAGSGMVVGGSTGSAHQTKKDIAAAINARST